MLDVFYVLVIILHNISHYKELMREKNHAKICRHYGNM